MQTIIDLRSDTVTKPTPEMRRAMYDADVGDDYYRDDPTVIRLEEKAAEMLGKEAAMLVLSGTMGNIVSVMALTQRGDSVVVEEMSHINNNEAGQLSALGGLTPRPVKGPRGYMEPEQIARAVLPDAVLHPPTRLLCLENTHNAAGGFCLSVEQTRTLAGAARKLGVAIHLDGARIFNAAVATGVPARELVADVDSVTFCLTKGLSCPAGSVVLGTREFVARAGHWRQLVGGGMRQAGVFAAAGLVALDSMIDRLAEDHANAKRLALLLADAGLAVNHNDVETNMVFLTLPESVMDAQRFVERLRAEGVAVNPPRGRRIRFVTHYGISADDIETAGAAVRRVLTNAIGRTRARAAPSGQR